LQKIRFKLKRINSKRVKKSVIFLALVAGLIGIGIVLSALARKSIFSADNDKLSQVLEHDENFGAAIEGLEKMDTFLN